MARFEVGDRVEALFDRLRDGLTGWTPGVVVEAPADWRFLDDTWVKPDGFDRPFWFANYTGKDIRRLET